MKQRRDFNRERAEARERRASIPRIYYIYVDDEISDSSRNFDEALDAFKKAERNFGNYARVALVTEELPTKENYKALH